MRPSTRARNLVASGAGGIAHGEHGEATPATDDGADKAVEDG